jgi:hypothetical protein
VSALDIRLGSLPVARLPERLVRNMLLLERIPLDRRAEHQAEAAKGDQRDPDGPQCVVEGQDQLVSTLALRHVLDDLDDDGGVAGVLVGEGRVGRQVEEFVPEGVLEDDARYGHADGLAEGAEEREESGGLRVESRLAGCLDRERPVA